MRKLTFLFLGAALGAGAVTFGVQTNLLNDGQAHAASADTYRKLSLFGDVFEKIRTDYVEVTDESKLIDAAINGMLASLDPHSSFMDPKAHREMQQQTRGELAGSASRSPWRTG
jgi:carboxyl-terminal processing protease